MLIVNSVSIYKYILLSANFLETPDKIPTSSGVEIVCMNIHVITVYYNPLSCNWSILYHNYYLSLNMIKTFHLNP